MARRILDRSRKNIFLEGVDRELFDRALAKAQAMPPPTNKLKWQIVRLIREWVDGTGRRRKTDSGATAAANPNDASSRSDWLRSRKTDVTP